jgi:hypothetical protein
MAHVIRVKYSNNDAVLSIDGKEMSISEDVAEMLINAIRTYLNEWFEPRWTSPTDATYTAPTSTMKVRVTKGNDAIIFIFEE